MRVFSFLVRRVLPWSLALLGACTDPYMPEAVTSPPSYLVVDGYLNPLGISTIKLSRTFAIASKATPPTETKATVYIEDEAGTRTLLRESPAGTYTSAFLTLNPARKYRLHLNTLAGKEYASDYVPVKITPPIDGVNWQAENSGLSIYVNAHDATNTTQYYRWETDETWEIHPVYSPSVEYVGNAMRPIVVSFPSICWGNTHSSALQLFKTTALTQDVVANYRLRQLAFNSEQLHVRYSILVQQHALTKPEYDYWELLRKNTESIGSLFDPQPAQLTGNVRCLSSPTDLTLGFIGAHSVTEKRIFITPQELPSNWHTLSGYETCQPPDTVSLYPPPPAPTPAEILASTFNPATGLLPIMPIYAATGAKVLAYTAKSRDCVDCRTRGASTKPSYWP
ncbi:DUF4249 domain-containing protein [Hymenobacter rubidus]|uniref:DUF4249 domain-containing protein n=1 Tax=Hymenobacter rubidus TaxID=1441626 RepID=UPI00191E19B2|nr:DUF4249 domain-containing protein [Hymenobacter rubidus]